MKFYIIIPVHNHCKITLECLRQLSLQTWKNYEVVVIDDGSSDGTYHAIKANFPNVKILLGNGNLWWAASINIGLKYILPKSNSEDYILMFNNDVNFNKNYLKNLYLSALMRPNWLIGSLVKDEEGKIIDRGISLNWKFLNSNQLNISNNDSFYDNINNLTGRGTLIPIRIIKKIGFLDEKRFPQYGGDTEYSFRAQKNGHSCCISCRSVLYSLTSITGYSFKTCEILSGNEAFRLLFNKKSKSNIIIKLRFINRCCPKEYRMINYLRTLRSAVLIIFSIGIIGKIKYKLISQISI